MNDLELDFSSPEPLYVQLRKILLEEIASNGYQPNDKFYSEAQIAELFNVSRITVNRALTELVYNDLLYRRPKKGTFVKRTSIARPKENQVNNNILLAIPKHAAGIDPFYSVVLEGIENEITGSGNNFSFFIIDGTDEKNKLFSSKIARKEMKGLILIGEISNPDIISNVIKNDIPFVLLFAPLSNNNGHAYSITVNDINGGYYATEYLIENGHKEIAYLGSLPHFAVSQLRLKGYGKALAEHNIPEKKELIYSQGYFDADSGYRMMQALLKSNSRPTAVFAGNDSVAIGAMRAINEKRLRIPDDISIIGFDNIEMASHMHPPLTTFNINKAEIGKTAANMLFRLINNDKIEKSELVIEPDLVVRDTIRNLNI